MMKKAKIIEIFDSIQGEGIYVGIKQLFIRFFGCDTGCAFCDEKNKPDFLEYSVEDIVNIAVKKGIKHIALTGGEPLGQAAFLEELLPILKNKDFKIYLETNGILKSELIKVIGYVDIVAMDIKLPSSTGIKAFWDEHRAFLREARNKEVFVKVIVTEKTSVSDIDLACSVVEEADRKIPFIIQPVSYNNRVASSGSLMVFFNRAAKHLDNVRLIPQVHNILGLR